MFTSIDENVFWQAIKEKDYLALKVNTVSTMLNDPTFERGETMKAIRILEEEVPEIFEEEVKLEYEERLEKSAWDKRYFTKLTYWFQKNFAKSRIDYIKEVGSVVHRDTAQQYNRSMAIGKQAEAETAVSNASGAASKSPKATAPKKNAPNASSGIPAAHKIAKKAGTSKENFPVAGAIVAVGALVLAGILLFKLL